MFYKQYKCSSATFWHPYKKQIHLQLFGCAFSSLSLFLFSIGLSLFWTFAAPLPVHAQTSSDHSIGNYVWLDLNNNGRADANEPPAPDGVVLALLNADGMSTGKISLTSNGFFHFKALDAGQYQVQIVAGNFITPTGKLAGYTHSTGSYQIVDPNQDVDQVDHGLDTSVPATNGITTGLIQLDDTEPIQEEPTASGLPGDDSPDHPDQRGNLTIDIGVAPIVTPTLSLGNRVWHDANANGFLDPDEAGIDGVDIQLYHAGQDPLAETSLYTQTTSSGGYYTFTNLVEDTYYLYIPTPPADLPQLSTPSITDTVPISATAPILATNPTTDTVPINEIANDVDNDSNGRQDALGGPVTSKHIPLEIGFEPVTDGDNAMSNLTLDFGFVATRTVEMSPTVEVTPTFALGDLVWHDANRNGLIDPDESGIPELELQLFVAGQDPLAATPLLTQTTSATGHYTFTDLTLQTYFVFIPTPPLEFPISSPILIPETLERTDNKGIQLTNGGAVQSAFIMALSEQTPVNRTIDFGFMEPQVNSFTVGNQVWHDANNNGLLDDGERGISDVELALYITDADPLIDSPLQQTITDINGHYQFEEVDAGNYFIYIAEPPNAFPNSSTTDAEITEQVDGDDNGVQTFSFAPVYTEEFRVPLGNTDSLALTAAQQNPSAAQPIAVIDSIDFGFFSSPLSIGDRVWFDNDADGIYEPNDGEAGVADVDVILYSVSNPGQPVARTTTFPNGTYLFFNILPDSYYLNFALDTLPAGYIATKPDRGGDDRLDSDADPQTGRAPLFGFIDTKTLDSSIDLGIIKTVSIGDKVWYDTNQDGIQAANETSLAGNSTPVGIPGVRVNLIDKSDSILMNQTTGSDGRYRFNDIAPGEYYVEFILPSGYIPSPKDVMQNSDDVFDSDADRINDTRSLRTELITLQSGEHQPTVDLGAYLGSKLPVSIGDYVWFDDNRDGSQGQDESGLPGVLVELINEDEGTVSRTSTDSNGRYQFLNLVPGNYQLKFLPPTGFIASPQNLGTNSSNDSDIDRTTGRTASTVLSSAEADMTWDAGFYTDATLLASIGDLVWNDSNLNGIQDEEMELAGIPGVVVTLYREDGGVVDIKVTDELGRYRFDNISSGIYYLGFDAPDQFMASLAAQGLDQQLDSDIDPETLLTEPTLLTPLEQDADFDAGFYVRGAASAGNVPSTLGNRVWLDSNQDGNQDLDESGIPNILVRLYSQQGELVAVTHTDETGSYVFRSVIPGLYYLEFTLPDSRYIFSPIDPALPDNSNSDVNPQTGRTNLLEIDDGLTRINWDAGMIDTTSGANGVLYLPLISHN